MKKSSVFTLILVVVFLFSCHHHSYSVIVTRTDNSEIRVEYTGDMAFNDDRTKLVGISSDGYIDFKRDNDELYVSPDGGGHIKYKLNGTPVSKLDNDGQGMLDEAIRMITKSSR